MRQCGQNSDVSVTGDNDRFRPNIRRRDQSLLGVFLRQKIAVADLVGPKTISFRIHHDTAYSKEPFR